MKNIFLAIFFLSSFQLFSQQVGFKLIDSTDFVIEQRKTYANPNFNNKSHYELSNFGPCFDETYISDEAIKTLSDLNSTYLKGKIWLPDDWPKTILIEGAVFRLAVFENGDYVPIIQTSDGTIFSFLIEEELLAIDIKNKYQKEGVWKVKFDTCEVEK